MCSGHYNDALTIIMTKLAQLHFKLVSFHSNFKNDALAITDAMTITMML